MPWRPVLKPCLPIVGVGFDYRGTDCSAILACSRSFRVYYGAFIIRAARLLSHDAAALSTTGLHTHDAYPLLRPVERNTGGPGSDTLRLGSPPPRPWWGDFSGYSRSRRPGSGGL